MFAKVAPIRRMPSSISELDYLVDQKKTPNLEIGHLVHIPFRNKLIFGLVTDLINKETELSKNKIKTVEEIFLQEVAVSAPQLNFLKEISEFYKAPLGFVLQSGLLPLKKTKINKLTLKKIEKNKTNKATKPELILYKTPEEKNNILRDSVSKDGQTLIIVPEVSAIAEIAKLLPADTAVISAELGEKEMYDLWHKIRNNEIKIVVGTRSALFMSWYNLQTVIVDDESNANHKSWDMAPRLHAREAGLMLAHAHQAKCILTTHTPSVESWYFARAKVYTTENKILPLHTNSLLIDMRDERRGRNYGFLSNDLREAMKQKTDGDIFLFLNRKGSSSYVGCRDCGFVAKCDTCTRGLVYHEKTSTLECHFCHTKKAMFLSCPKCRGANVVMYGAGTQLVENDLKKNNIFNREIIRLDADTQNLHTLDDTKNKIIIGTQIAWDKINWKRVSLMAFLEADSALFIPEYKMSETIWWQLRDAQFHLPPTSDLFIQSSHNEHHALANLASPNRFYDQEEAQRRLFGYPPFNYLIRAFIGQKTPDLTRKMAEDAYRHLSTLTKGQTDIIISDPLPFSPFYTHGAYWYALIIKTKFNKYKHNTKWLVANLGDDWKFDPNPANLLSF